MQFTNKEVMILATKQVKIGILGIAFLAIVGLLAVGKAAPVQAASDNESWQQGMTSMMKSVHGDNWKESCIKMMDNLEQQNSQIGG